MSINDTDKTKVNNKMNTQTKTQYKKCYEQNAIESVHGA